MIRWILASVLALASSAGAESALGSANDQDDDTDQADQDEADEPNGSGDGDADAADSDDSPLLAPVHLPTPRALATDVHFWERIFTEFTPDQCVFHDRENLAMIYAVKRLPGETPVRQARAVRRYLGALRAAIKHLADGGTPANLLEHRIVQVTLPSQRNPAFWRNAMDNVRCQRGVDLAPSLARSKQHIKMVKRVLAEHGLPTDLAFLPHLESGFNIVARSRAGARGLWQLMPATARLAGLRVSPGSDYRVNPYKATVAAAGMLRDFFTRTKNWPLAITAYNYGINGTSRAIKLYGNDYMAVRQRHHTRLFGFAARNYYPSFLAVRNIAAASDGLAMGRSPQAAGL